jgi:hypothetical protein
LQGGFFTKPCDTKNTIRSKPTIPIASYAIAVKPMDAGEFATVADVNSKSAWIDGRRK